MNTRCAACGGRFKRSDIVGEYDPKLKRTMFRDTDPLVAHWRCDGCGATRKQKKR